MIREAIILAGGMGTRLQSVLPDLPKPMAPINGKPFLEYVLNYLIRQQIEKVILSVGYKYNIIQDHFGNHYNDLSLVYEIEKEPLGTGGAIKKSMDLINGTSSFILNGDTFFDVDLKDLFKFHYSNKSSLTIALKQIQPVYRYGTVETDMQGRITAFNEKKEIESGMINGGIYLIDTAIFEQTQTPARFSFEKDFMERHYRQLNCFGLPFDNYFIDIGVPEDYTMAQKTLS
ncbi:nucleotidyltransferase family protein [bacterium]|nr:nucleotidyltransferase family protein [bacterium]